MEKVIMAIGAHIGDVELTCGPLLAQHSALGDHIVTVALSAGERGAPPNIPVHEFTERNIQAAHGFARALGGQFVCVGYPDGEVPDGDALRYRLCDIIREYKPGAVVTHWKGSMHRDHITCARAVDDAIFLAAMADIKRELPHHWADGPYFAENWEDADGFEPYLYIDVSKGYALWYAEVQKLWLTNNSPWFKYLTYYDALSAANGALAHRERAVRLTVPPHARKLVKDALV